MSGVRVLVGTRKGAFVLTSDAMREQWEISGPHFRGWEIFHVKGSPADPERLYASQYSAWFGQLIQRSNDGGKTWESGGENMAFSASNAASIASGAMPRFCIVPASETSRLVRPPLPIGARAKPPVVRALWPFCAPCGSWRWDNSHSGQGAGGMADSLISYCPPLAWSEGGATT